MSFRSAGLYDARLLYEWRREDEAQPWYQGGPLSFDDHAQWLQTRLWNPLVKLLIWEHHGVPVGMVRVDSNGEVAFHGDDPAMLAAVRGFAVQYGGRLKATLDQDDPRAKMLVDAGFEPYPARALTYKP